MQKLNITENLDMSRIIYGMWRLGDDTNTSAKHVQAKIETCLEQGITTFDQADIYGDYASEEILGAALKQAPQLRDSMQIITKCDIMLTSDKYPNRRVKYYDTSAAHITASVENSLRVMNIDQIDMLLLHRPDPLMDAAETGAALDDLITSGKIKSAGVSNFKPHDCSLLLTFMNQPLVANQIELSLLENSALTNGDLAFMQECGIAPMAWSALAGGALFAPENATLLDNLARIGADHGIDASAVAVAWLLAHPAKIMPVLGTNNLDRIAKLSDATRMDMDRETWFELYEIANGHEVA
ncbi:aryl-alcohol dehydrogenase [Amylibacter marinus]|uniref:Aryl-alcohol dehydrogenase n=1 Tax=Amylibacter marinus TaxID=1475483 RepID=A0ABQ5VY17_9RHOB|nr:aldo/keto reductase [Amylibacter marinus]GLQ36338.1 aryl-alcohol dehydrogenase [Amylibacter marinus]